MRTPEIFGHGAAVPTLPRAHRENKRKHCIDRRIDAEAHSMDNFWLVAAATALQGYVAQPVRAQHS